MFFNVELLLLDKTIPYIIICSKYHSGSYEPPWDLAYPSFSQLGVLQHHHNPGMAYPNNMAALPHDNMCAHNSAATNNMQNSHSPYR